MTEEQTHERFRPLWWDRLTGLDTTRLYKAMIQRTEISEASSDWRVLYPDGETLIVSLTVGDAPLEIGLNVPLHIGTTAIVQADPGIKAVLCYEQNGMKFVRCWDGSELA